MKNTVFSITNMNGVSHDDNKVYSITDMNGYSKSKKQADVKNNFVSPTSQSTK